MAGVPFQTFALECDLNPSPIEASWITAGQPVARNRIVSRSADWSSYTMVWECTAGCFDWTYDCDETVHILEGSILLSDSGNPVRRLQAGDCVFFPKGAQVSWEVEGYVRKLAFMRDTLPRPLSIMLKVMRRLRKVARMAARPVQGLAALKPRLMDADPAAL